ncbi:MAG: hypothetical protein AB7T06_16315 [Kofleriaceae bacterium]
MVLAVLDQWNGHRRFPADRLHPGHSGAHHTDWHRERRARLISDHDVGTDTVIADSFEDFLVGRIM